MKMTHYEIIKKCNGKPDLWNRWRKLYKVDKINLEHANLSYADLYYTILEGVII